MNLRATAAKVILDVIDHHQSLTDALTKTLQDPRDQALLQAICFGVCRWFFRLDAIVRMLLKKPLKDKDRDIYALLLVGLYQLMEMRIPPYAAISETVNAAQSFKKPWAKGFINGVLRHYQRSENDFATIALASHPSWLIEKIKVDYPHHWEQIITANNAHPPLALRVNQQQISREKYLEQCEGASIIPETSCGIILGKAMDVRELPGFLQGFVSVQDGAAQLAVDLLALEPGHSVLDACAAPGGKTAAILEKQSHITCIAIDQDPVRLTRVKENLTRLKLQATCLAADVGDIQTWWDGKLFDRILLDVPCTASGVIRRHPDIKLLREPEDIISRAREQQRLLKAAWSVLKSGGLLVYATCSIFPEENVDIVKQFLLEQPDALAETIEASWGLPCEVGRQILPGMHTMDGFYYACLRKSEIN